MPPYRDPDNLNQRPGNFSFPAPSQPSWVGLYGTAPIPQPTRTSGAAAVYPAALGRPAPKPAYTPLQTTEAQRRAQAAPSGGGGYAGGGGGYGGGDGFSPYATPNIGQDPAYLAFLRSIGIEKAELNQSAEDRIGVINREITRRLSDILRGGEYAREGISGNYESRGVYRSGKHEQSLARQRADEGAQAASLQGAGADQVFLIRQELARRLAAAERQGAEAGLSAAGNVYG